MLQSSVATDRNTNPPQILRIRDKPKSRFKGRTNIVGGRWDDGGDVAMSVIFTQAPKGRN